MWTSIIYSLLLSVASKVIDPQVNSDKNLQNPEKNCDSLNNFNNSLHFENMIFVLIGPSQAGKSTLINNFLDINGQPYERASVGSNIKKSETLEIKLYKIGPVQELFPNLKAGFLYIVDTPGFFDSELRLTDDEILENLKLILLKLNIKYLDAILLFESMNNDSSKILLTLKWATSLFGPSIIKSSVLLTTKWDRVDKNDLEMTEAYLNSLIIKTGLHSFKWQNNIKNKLFLNSQQMKQQLKELGEIISQVKPYEISGIQEFHEKRDKIAFDLREKDPDRYTYSHEKEIILVPQEYLEEEFFDVDENIPLSQEEIDEKAGEMWKKQPEISGGLIPDPDGKRITEKKIIKTPKLVTKYRRVCVTRIFGICVDHSNIPYQEVQEVFEEITEDKGPLLIQAPNIKHPIDYFKNLIRNDVKTVKVRKASTIKKIRMIEKEESKVFKNEKYLFEHYQGLANELFQEEFRLKFRQNNRCLNKM